MKPGGSVSVIEANPAAPGFGVWTVIVYPSVAPAIALGESAVFEVVSGTRPWGEKCVRCERVTEPPGGMAMPQLRPAPLSRWLAHAQVSGKPSWAPIRAQTVL